MSVLVISVCVCFFLSMTSAQSTIDDDFMQLPMLCVNVMERLIQLQADVDQLKTAAVNPGTSCPSPFTYVPSVNGCYSVVLDNLEWTIAALRCKSLHPNAHLLIVNNAAEQRAIETMIRSYNESSFAGCARYPDNPDTCREMFWTAGQRVDLWRSGSPFVWNQTPGSGAANNSNNGAVMSEMRYTNWLRGEPNNSGSFNAALQRTSTRLQEKCMQICRGWHYHWNDALCEIPTCAICEIDQQ